MANLASTSRTQVRYIKEVTPGTTPVTGNATDLRVTGESLDRNVTKVKSDEIRSDRQISSVTPTSASTSGGLNFEFSYGEFDPFLEAVMQDNYTVYGTNGVGTTFTCDFLATTMTASVAPTGANAFTTLQKGQWFRVSAGANANNGKLLRVSTVTAPTSTVITLDTNTPAVVSAAVANVAVQTSRLVNGTLMQYFTLEKQFGGLGAAGTDSEFFSFKGMTPSKLSLEFSAASKTTGSLDFMGYTGSQANTTILPGTANASRSYDIHNGASGISNIWLNGAPTTVTQFVKSLSLSLDNGLRGQEGLGTLGYVGIGNGTLNMTGTMTMYFADGAMYQQFLANTYASITVGSIDASGNGYFIALPKLSLTTAKVVAGGKDQDLMVEFTVDALVDDTNATAALRKSVIIDRVGAALAPSV